MKIDEITMDDVVSFLRLEEDEYKPVEIKAIMAAAKSFIIGHTHLPVESTDGQKTINDYDDFYIAYMVLCQDMHENRTFTVDKDKINPTVEAILGMHSYNLVG